MTTYALLHGFMGSAENWRPVGERLAAAGSEGLHTRAVALDIYGHFDPERAADDPATADLAGPRSDSSSVWKNEVTRLADRLWSLPSPVHLVGYSLGARLALAVLCDHSELFVRGPVRFATLIGVNPGLPGDPDDVVEGSEREARIAADEEWATLLEQDYPEFLDRWQQQPVFAGLADRASESALDRDRKLRLKHDPKRLAQALRKLGLGQMPDYGQALANLDLPISIVIGEHDEKFWNLARNVAVRLPMASIHVVKDVGHNVLLERPEALDRILVPMRQTTLTELDSHSLSLGEIQAELEKRK
jgi:2-succinyl-6-hydroxy-2,4-cyclohexadiene-1-carboxylate synthase